MANPNTKPIRDQNDRFRSGDTSVPGQIVITQGVNSLIDETLEKGAALARIIQNFDEFETDNDPHGEHDFGAFDFEGQKCFWKIDLYDKSYSAGSEEPSDLAKTNRVLTVMLASEY